VVVAKGQEAVVGVAAVVAELAPERQPVRDRPAALVLGQGQNDLVMMAEIALVHRTRAAAAEVPLL
tara:strand:- start:706 stop:903 length:198 start_codon:yes stop_codon:yes gene_type:complete